MEPGPDDLENHSKTPTKDAKRFDTVQDEPYPENGKIIACHYHFAAYRLVCWEMGIEERSHLR